MRIRLAHGSRKTDLTELQPMSVGGENGSQDGIGINLTADGAVARHYAGNDGAVYLVDIDISRFLTVSDHATLGHGHAEILKMHLATLPEHIQYRLASDICGKAQRTFDNDADAERFYKEKRAAFTSLDLHYDRLKPDIDYHDDGRMIIVYAHNDFDNLYEASTRRLHYCLNLYDNSVATSLLKTICNGLVLARDNGKHHYLSFRASEAVAHTLNADTLQQPNSNDLIERACRRGKTHALADNNAFPPY